MAASRRNCIPRPLLHMPSNPQACCLRYRLLEARPFSSSVRRLEQEQRHRKESFSSRLRSALSKTKIQWYPIPVGLGIGFLGFLQFTKIQRREKEREDGDGEAERTPSGRPKRRKRPKPEGPWYGTSFKRYVEVD